MSKFFAVDGMQLEFVNPSESGVLTMVTPASTKLKGSSKGVYKNGAIVQVTNFANSSVTGGVGTGSFIATSTKNKTEGVLVLRADDLATITGTGNNVSPPPTTLPFTTTVKIKDAGQTKLKGQ